jgi:hypothetical protein
MNRKMAEAAFRRRKPSSLKPVRSPPVAAHDPDRISPPGLNAGASLELRIMLDA